jgi:predicted unusual protein kinase regulating ubiquinone biosynthesis (AarF/ABC1/UbiB family)
MEYIHGVPLLNMQKLKEEKYDFIEMAHTISLVFSRLLFKYGYVHSDPHQVE